MSRYAKRLGDNEWGGGSEIIPMTVEEAKKWAEKHLTAKEYEEAFGIIEDDAENEKMTWTINVSPATIERVRRLAGEQNKKLSEIIENAVAAYSKN